jgi:hypothetical protein
LVLLVHHDHLVLRDHHRRYLCPNYFLALLDHHENLFLYLYLDLNKGESVSDVETVIRLKMTSKDIS